MLAWGQPEGDGLRLLRLDTLDSLDAYACWAAMPGEWIGGFDFPFGLPRPLVTALGWPLAWEACMHHYASLERAEIRQHFKAWCDARPAGSKFAHRATDGPAGSSPSMKWVNPPVAYMLHAGVPPLVDGGVHLPGLMTRPSEEGPAGRRRVALEAYPGLLAREVLGRASYKSDDPSAPHAPRRACRARLVEALEAGDLRLGIALRLDDVQRHSLVDDARGDRLDAVLCLVQAAWASRQGPPLYGLPADMDPLEGWIVGAVRKGSPG